MKILSLWQPWATLMAAGYKRVETRSWSTQYRGPVAIHAARKWNSELDQLSRTETFDEALAGEPENLPLGVILAVGSLVDVCPTHAKMRGDSVFDRWPGLVTAVEEEFGNYSPGRFAWVFDDIQRLSTPLPWKGSQGLRELPPEVSAVLRSTISKVVGD